MASRKSLGYVQTTDVSTAKSIANLAPTGVVPPATDHVVIQCESQNCRYTLDGSTPTAAVGTILVANLLLTLTKGEFNNLKIIQAAASAKVNAEFFQTG